ncbi:MAG: HesA/MoeB/ThiF family protein [Solirubrobacteraceae bacterium]
MFKSKATAGTFDITIVQPERLVVVTGWGYRSAAHGFVHTSGSSPLHDQHFAGKAEDANGFWYRVDPELHATWIFAARRDACLPMQVLHDSVEGWHQPGGEAMMTPIITIASDAENELLGTGGWIIQNEQLVPVAFDVVDVGEDRLAPLSGHWPMQDLEHAKILIVGAGSIGSAACEALSNYGARRLTIVDPDHLSPHNFARHTAHCSEVGRLKVNAVAKQLRDRDSEMDVTATPIDVIFDADAIRGELTDAQAVLVCVDGVEPRRVANHLAVRAGIPLVLACVLDNGRVGEILRVLPRRHECLSCNRSRLAAQGALALEAALDRGYGQGTRQLPMTAVGGDLALVGQLAAKVTVATILERAGHPEQRLPGEHATIGLRPSQDLPRPFDAGLGEVHWVEGHPPQPHCITCRWS